jgi:hypothetical protein
VITQKRKAQDLYANGMSRKHIAQFLGIQRGYVDQMLSGLDGGHDPKFPTRETHERHVFKVLQAGGFPHAALIHGKRFLLGPSYHPWSGR